MPHSARPETRKERDLTRKGRGTVSDLPGRYASTRIEWEPDADLTAKPPETELREMQAKSIIGRNTSPDIPFDRSINPYLGCEHGCSYCYARPSHSYLDLSPGIDFETKIFYKANAVERLRAEWQKPSYVCKPITIGANTDPYQPAEKKLRITRALLKLFLSCKHPVSLITKGGLMSRDMDILADLAAKNLVSVAVSVPTMNDALKRIMEPRVPSSRVRFDLMRQLAQATVPVSVLVAPIIPALNDHEIETILTRSSANGAVSAGWILLRLPHELKQIFVEWLEQHMPNRAEHVMSLLRQASGGTAYDPRFGKRQRGSGPYAEMIGRRFNAACRKLAIVSGRSGHQLDCSQFRPPERRQLSLDFT